MIIKNYNYSEKDITMVLSDNASGQYLWIAFSQNNDGNCILQKVSGNDPLQVYFNIELAITKIVKGFILSSYLYLAYDDSSLIGAKYSISSPLSSSSDFSLPAGITEAPIDILVNGTDVFYLFPGNTSGQNAKIVKMNTTGVYDQTIDLATVTNATSFTIDDNDEIWIVTNNSPSEYVRVWLDGTWQYQVFN